MAAMIGRVQALEEQIAKAPRGPPDLTKLLFGKQYAFVVDEAREGSACCTRRAGKTIGVVVKLARTTAAKPGSVGLYLTTNRLVAKRNAWDALKEWAPLFGFTLEPLEAELCVRHPNGSRVYLSGAKDKGEVEKFRGMPLAIVIIDESQSFRPYIEQLVDDVLGPALMDFAGAVWLIGTPGPVPVGYFYKATQRKDWAQHHWSARDNPHIERKSGRTFDELLAHELKRRGVTADHPSIQREWFGKWVLDTDSLVFKYDAAKNDKRLAHHDNYVICGDLGWDDADAIGVLGWSEHSPCVELVYEWVANKKTISEYIDVLRPLYEKYKPLAVVLDCGALGKKIAEEITQRTSIPIEAADKHRKLEHIELLNDALRTEKFYAPKESRFAQDCALVEWDRSNPEKPEISERYHSDICDAVLYGWRWALAWLYEAPEAEGPKRGTPEWYEAQQSKLQKEVEAAFEEQFERNRNAQEEGTDWP